MQALMQQALLCMTLMQALMQQALLWRALMQALMQQALAVVRAVCGLHSRWRWRWRRRRRGRGLDSVQQIATLQPAGRCNRRRACGQRDVFVLFVRGHAVSVRHSSTTAV